MMAAAIILLLMISKNFNLFSVSPLIADQRVTLAVPFDKNDSPYGLIPMGETIYHPKPKNPKGHSGIDFQWDHKALILSAAEGIVIGIKKVAPSNTWNVSVVSGKYLNVYTELESYNPKLKAGIKVEQGAFIGYPWHPPGTKSGYRMTHWEFGHYAGTPFFPDRLCPLDYFDTDSRALMENIWENTNWEHKTEFPDICNGDYKDKNK